MRLKARSTKQHFLFFVAATALLMSSSCLGQASPTPQSASSGTSEDIIPFLNQNIVWYRQLAIQEQLATEPSDVLFLSDNRQIANQVVRLAFDFARARAQALSTPPIAAAGTSQGGQFQRLAESAGRADQNVKSSKKQIAEIQHQLLTATGKKRQTLLASLDEAQSELELFQARSEVLHGLLQFATGSTGSGSGNLLTQVEELSHAIPAAAVANAKDANAENNKAAATFTRERRGQPSGILAIVTDLFALRSKLQALKENVRQTDALQQASKDLRTPLVAKLRELSQEGDQLAAAPDSQDPKALAQQSKNLDALTQQYKQLSATVVPLGKQNILLDVYRRSTGNWAKAVETEYYNELKALGVRVAGLTVVLLLVFGISQLTRRATFRYITEPRRRYQILLLRRVLLWTIFTIILVIAFASELSGIGTFAGLLTAGVAFSLQNVILSVVGYFLLIGKYGVRAGDRVQIAGVTGDVVEVGLIRLHLMELTAGPNPHPTGRVAAFSNALVFQAGAGLFKQIPGTSFVWHEITLTLGPESNYREAEQRLMEAVNAAFADYKEKMELQRRGMERALSSVPTTALKPESHLHFTPAGLEVVIRYPVELGHAAEMDDRVTRELLAALDREPKLRLLGSAGPVASAHAAA
jgi:small-conductance mechanosensitive channel